MSYQTIQDGKRATPGESPGAAPVYFTAAQIAAALRCSPQAVRRRLAEVSPVEFKKVNGNDTAAWSLNQMPANWKITIQETAIRFAPENLRLKMRKDFQAGNLSHIEAFLAMPSEIWKPAIPLDQVSAYNIDRAKKLRDALRPYLAAQHDVNLKWKEVVARGVGDYGRIFGNLISTRYWQELFARTIQRDNGSEEWERLEIYLDDRLKREALPAFAPRADLANSLKDFASLDDFISQCSNPNAPNENERQTLWTLALEKCRTLVKAGYTQKNAARSVRDFLFDRAKFLAPSREALLMAFNRKLKRWKPGQPASLADGRKNNGDRANYPSKDIRMVRHSAVLKNGKRIDTAWREEYPYLSDYTRQRHPCTRKCPRPFYRLVNRMKVDALFARLQGKRALKKVIGGVTRDAEGIPSMARWSVDDMTSNIEVAFQNESGGMSLIQPQIIAVMDFASRKWVGWAISADKSPTAELVCAAVLDGFKRHGVPRQLWLENGFVFGKSLNVNGKLDDEGRTVVGGLGQYGCSIHHFNKMNPTSKAELEKSFDLFQRNMERHPGYTGRNQMFDASEDFKREQRFIRSGKVLATKFRYTYEEFIHVMQDLVEKYNSAPQNGLLRGLSPNEAFEILADRNDPPIQFNNELHWMLAYERYRVEVKPGGVTIRHYGRPAIQVRGGELPQHIGEWLWASVDRKDDSLVTFMTLDFGKTFTVEACKNPSATESLIASGSSVLGDELAKINMHSRAIGTELNDLKREFGNPRHDLLAKMRGETMALSNGVNPTTRRVILDKRIEASATQREEQREEIKEAKKRLTTNKSKAFRKGISPLLAEDNERFERGLELLGDNGSQQDQNKT